MLQHFIDDFFDCAAQQLPLLISTEWMEEPIYYEDYALFVFNPSVSFNLESIMNMLEDEMVLIPPISYDSIKCDLLWSLLLCLF